MKIKKIKKALNSFFLRIVLGVVIGPLVMAWELSANGEPKAKPALWKVFVSLNSAFFFVMTACLFAGTNGWYSVLGVLGVQIAALIYTIGWHYLAYGFKYTTKCVLAGLAIGSPGLALGWWLAVKALMS